MSENAVRVENVSKRYLIGHQFAFSRGRPKYTLRDVIRRELYSFARKAIDFAHGRQVVQGDSIEEFWALRNISFNVKQGEVLGIIGRNGAGKSTLLKVLSQITEPTEGRIELRGRVSSLLEVGTGFHPELTGRENIFLNGAILGMTQREIRKKFDEIVAIAEVEKFLDTPVKHYSSGMYVRLAFAVAAHLEPEILVVDEVLAVGDYEFQKKCLGKMDEVSRKQGRTVLFVSHNMSAIQQLCTRAVLLREGQPVGNGESAQVIRQYLSYENTGKRVPLREWKDRITNGDAMITDFELYDSHGTPIDFVEFGQQARFLMTVEIQRPVRQAVFGIYVHSTSGEPILELWSSNDGLRLDHGVGRVTIEVTTENIRLYPGEYTLSPWVYDELTKADIDWPRHCRRVRVVLGPGTHGDLRLDPKWGKYFVQSSWKILDVTLQPEILSLNKIV
jgi:lipopolysaccharide transport system ATP-binding protein